MDDRTINNRLRTTLQRIHENLILDMNNSEELETMEQH